MGHYEYNVMGHYEYFIAAIVVFSDVSRSPRRQAYYLNIKTTTSGKVSHSSLNIGQTDGQIHHRTIVGGAGRNKIKHTQSPKDKVSP